MAIAQTGGALISLALRFPRQWELVEERPWRGNPLVCLPLEHGGQRLGLLALGPRLVEGAYSVSELAALQQTALDVAHAIHVQRKA